MSRASFSLGPKMFGKNSGRMRPSTRLASVMARRPPFLQSQSSENLKRLKEGGLLPLVGNTKTGHARQGCRLRSTLQRACQSACCLTFNCLLGTSHTARKHVISWQQLMRGRLTCSTQALGGPLQTLARP